MLSLIGQFPGKVTLLAIGPLTNVAAGLDRDPMTMRKLKRIVIMGGSVRRGYDDLVSGSYDSLGYPVKRPPSVEYNIAMDPGAARQVFRAGIPLFVIPVDASQHRLDEVKRMQLFTRSTPLTDALALLYAQWSRSTKLMTAIMFDAVAADTSSIRGFAR